MKFEKVKNRDTIWQPCHDFWCRMCGWYRRLNVTRFGKTWHNFWHACHVFKIRLVVPWVVSINR